MTKLIQVFGATLEGAGKLKIGGEGWCVRYTSHTQIKADPGVIECIRPHLVVHLDPPPAELEDYLPIMCGLYEAQQIHLCAPSSISGNAPDCESGEGGSSPPRGTKPKSFVEKQAAFIRQQYAYFKKRND